MLAYIKVRPSKGRTYLRPIIFLTGGLGNQLFQIAQAKHMFGEMVVELDWRIGRPRLNASGMPEVADFNLGEKFIFTPKTTTTERYLKPSQPLRYIFNLYLRNSVSSTPRLTQQVINGLCRILWPLAGLIYRRQILYLNGQGARRFGKRPCLVGYFQNPIWLEDKKLRDDLMQLKVDSETVRVYEEYALAENPLCVHMRMTDYRFDSRIGMIERDYFVQGLRKELARGNYEKIWLFSDEPIIALDSLSEFKSKIRLIENNISSTETLKLMNLCKGFVISNSTFSWWGAYLSKADPKNITAPYPWFKGQKTPERLLPESWQKSNPWH